MSPDLFARLAADPEFRTGVAIAPREALAGQALTALQQRLARLAAHRLERHDVPYRSYLWWDSDEGTQLVNCLG